MKKLDQAPAPNPLSVHKQHMKKEGQYGWQPLDTIASRITEEDTTKIRSMFDQLTNLASNLLNSNSTPNAGTYPIPPSAKVNIFPAGTSSADICRGVHGTGLESVSKEQKDIITMLSYLVEGWGNDSLIVSDKKADDDTENFDGYLAALLKDENGEVVAFVADAFQIKNAIYIWRKDVSDVSDWTTVIEKDKKAAKEESQALAVYHTGDTTLDRVLSYLTATPEKFEDEWLKRSVR